MTAPETLRIALRALWRNRLRSFLTALGVVIGVGAVIAMVAIGEGAKSRVEEQFASMGSNLLMVMSGSSAQGGARGGFGSSPTLTWDDLRAIRTDVPSVRYAAPQLRQNILVIGDDTNWTTTVIGSTDEYFLIRNWSLSSGVPFTQSDVESGAKVAVLGATVAEKLFGRNTDPVGAIVRLRNVPFEVIGVLSAKGQSPMGQDYDDTLIVPSSTFSTKLQGGLKNYINGMITASAVSPEDTVRAERQIAALLRDRHRLQPGTEDDFSVRNMAEMASAQQEGTRTLTTLLASIAAVSLLVGGIGIMNIMLVSVTERTREIGLRIAVGARRRDIMAQFLVEALALSAGGGAIGVALGLLMAARLAAQFGWPMLVQPQVVLMAVGVSLVVGIGFGLYPARKASRLDPIEALRFE
jgi:putative ABC transport system permease protein